MLLAFFRLLSIESTRPLRGTRLHETLRARAVYGIETRGGPRTDPGRSEFPTLQVIGTQAGCPSGPAPLVRRPPLRPPSGRHAAPSPSSSEGRPGSDRPQNASCMGDCWHPFASESWQCVSRRTRFTMGRVDDDPAVETSSVCPRDLGVYFSGYCRPAPENSGRVAIWSPSDEAEGMWDDR